MKTRKSVNLLLVSLLWFLVVIVVYSFTFFILNNSLYVRRAVSGSLANPPALYDSHVSTANS